MNHHFDLSNVPHRPGRSTDLEAKRLRAWARLSEDEKEYILENYDSIVPDTRWRITFQDMKDTYERVLYVLAVTELRFTPAELVYVMITRWFRNVDQATVRAKLADMANRGQARSAHDGRVHITALGRQRMDELDGVRTGGPEQPGRQAQRTRQRPTASRNRSDFAPSERERGPQRPTGQPRSRGDN